MPDGYLPRPKLPTHYLGNIPDPTERKQWKNKKWISVSLFEQQINTWFSQSDSQPASEEMQNHSHNSINRLTGTTGQDGLAPYSVGEYWHGLKTRLVIFAVIDEAALAPDLLEKLFIQIGQFGFGKDASSGLGKFSVECCEKVTLVSQKNANAWLTLAPCAPQGLGYDGANSYWQPLTRYGRHGNIAALSGKPLRILYCSLSRVVFLVGLS